MKNVRSRLKNSAVYDFFANIPYTKSASGRSKRGIKSPNAFLKTGTFLGQIKIQGKVAKIPGITLFGVAVEW